MIEGIRVFLFKWLFGDDFDAKINAHLRMIFEKNQKAQEEMEQERRAFQIEFRDFMRDMQSRGESTGAEDAINRIADFLEKKFST